MASNRYKDLFEHLKGKGYKIYPPTGKMGQCLEPYLVINGAGVLKFEPYSSTQHIYDIMLYVPVNKFSEIEDLMNNLKAAMQELEPMFKPAYVETPPFYDESVNGFMVSVQYINYRQIIR